MKPRGRNGPFPATIPLASASNDNSAAAAVSTVSLFMLNRMLETMSTPAGTLPGAMAAQPAVPAAIPPPAIPAAAPPPPPASVVSRVPDVGQELHTCLEDFRALRGIDLTGAEDALASLDFTPDVIPSVSLARLCEVLGAVEGRALKLQIFCKTWYDELMRMQDVA